MSIDRLLPQARASYRSSISTDGNAAGKPVGQPAADGLAPTVATTSVDQLQLSAATRELGRVQQQVNQAPDVREARVAALRAQVQNGTYHVDAELLAQRLMRLNLP